MKRTVIGLLASLGFLGAAAVVVYTTGCVDAVVSWGPLACMFAGCVGLGGHALVLRRAARSRNNDDATAARQAQEAGARAVVALALAIFFQLAVLPFYVRRFIGHTVKADFVSVTAEGHGEATTFKVHAEYTDASGQRQSIEDDISPRMYGRYRDMSVACDMAKVAGQLVDADVPDHAPAPRSEPQCDPYVDFVVVDGVPGLAQMGSRPTVPAMAAVGALVLWLTLLFAIRRSWRERGDGSTS
jgi:hypothetical protein